MHFRGIAALLLVIAGNASAQSRPPGSIAINAPNAIHSMDAANTTYSSIQITKGAITALSNDPIQGAMTLPANAAVYPGFIDTHSHAISLLTAQATDRKGNPYWISLANVNVMLLPPCKTPTPGSTTCFTPVTTQAMVNSLLTTKPNAAGWILGWNYEPSRLACRSGDTATYGFLCPNFENQNQQTARQQLDALQPATPVLVTSESGHIVYVNSAALNLLNICNVNPNNVSGCYTPVNNPKVETNLARTGQLNEDLALYAISYVENVLANNYAGGPCKKKDLACEARLLEFFGKQIRASLSLYSQLGYTTVQEGAAGQGLIELYMATAKAMSMSKSKTYLPATMAFLEYDGTTPGNFGSSVAKASAIQKKLSSGGYDMFVAGMKVFADGSNQGYTGDMASPVTYMNLNKPFTDPDIFPQPYDGLPDYDASAVASAANAAHGATLPLWVHTNGNQAQTNVIGALSGQTAPPLRDVIVHFTMPTQTQVQSLASKSIGVTFLANDFYYYYQPLCEQILGGPATQNMYPAQWAQESGLHWSLHSDASVTAPAPMFGTWVATTRAYQSGIWLPPLSTSQCTASAQQSQAISRLQAMRAYTSNGAWLYGRENKIGSLQNGLNGDLVVLSADPLDPSTDLSKVYVLYTIHNGNIVYPASGSSPAKSGPAWPN